jgi:uncharacterized protein
MYAKLLLIPLFVLIFILVDLYVFQAIKVVDRRYFKSARSTIFYIYWGITVITLIGFMVFHFAGQDAMPRMYRNFIMVIIFMNYFSKLFAMVFLLIDDLIRLGKWIYRKVAAPRKKVDPKGESIPRSEFLTRTALVAAAVPVVGMTWGILSGAHDYRVRRKVIALPNLPAAFHGIKIAQVSDIHSGSFFNKTAVKGGVEMLMDEKPDVVFFTGDLVNNLAKEVKDYIPVFEKVKAPLGVYSVLGNHDYGDYVAFDTPADKVRNLEHLKYAHKLLGWDLLLDEHRFLKQGSDQIAILGIENWGAKSGFPQYGNLYEAYKGTEDAPVKLLLSHDPSHWDAQVRPEFPDIDVMFAGHTHGMQVGIEVPGFRWSPVQYVYDQWAGLYQNQNQYLYVNRGYGYLGYPGRLGILPEITIIELQKG